jgi:hypothetical protein
LVKLALLVTLVAAVPASAQEPPLPEGVIARVGDELVLKSDFDPWYGLLASQTRWLASDPPDYERCIATFRKRAAKHGRHPTRRSLRRRCEERVHLIHDVAMTVVLGQVWLRQEAMRVGIKLSLRKIARMVARLRRTADADDRTVLGHFTDAQLAAAIANTMLFERLIKRVEATIPEVTHAQVERYYAQHRHRYRHLSRERALTRIETRLEQQREWRAAERFFRGFFARYHKLTECAEGYIVEYCANSESDGSDEDVTYERSRGMVSPV